MSYIVYEGLSTPNEVLSKMADYIERSGYTIVSPLADDANIYDRSTVDGKKIVFQDKTNEYFVSLRSANGTNIFGTNDDAQMDVTSADKDTHYYGIGMTVSEGYSKAQRWYNQYNAPIQYRGKDVQGVFMPVTQGTAITVQERPTKVDYPTPVDEPVKEDYPDAPVKDDYPTKPTEPQDPTVVRSDKNASLNRKIAPRITNIHGTDPFSLQQYDIDKYGGNGVPLADLFYDSSHQYNNDIVVLFDNNSMKIVTNGNGATREKGNGFKNQGMYVNGDGNYKDIIEVFGEEISTLTEQTFMDRWNAMPEPWKEQFSVGSNFNFPFNIIEQRNTGDVNASAVFGSVGITGGSFTNMIVGIAMPKSVFDKLKNFSKTISDYNTALTQYQSDLATYNQQVAAIDAKYDKDLKDYQDACDAIDTDYNNKVADYNEYLKKLKDYSDYLEKEDSYIEYLLNKNATGFTYNLYCNEVTKPTNTLTFSLVKQGQRVVDKVTDAPTRPTAPVKPVKAQYPNKPTKPIIRETSYHTKAEAGFLCVLVGDNGSDIGCGSVSDLQSYAININNKLNDLNSSAGTNYSGLHLNLYTMQVVTADTNLQSICDSLGKSDGVTYVPVIKGALISSLTTSSTYDFGMSYSITSYMTEKDFSISSYTRVFPYMVSKDKVFKCYSCNFMKTPTQNNYTLTSTGSSSKQTYDTTVLYLVPKDILINNYKSNKANNFELDNIIGYYNQTSDDWVQYKADCAKIDNDYSTAMTQYNKDLTQYQADMKTYDTAYDAYIKDLENGIGITYKDDETALLYQTTHLIFGNLDKYDTWTGGAYFSGSATRYMMKTAYKVYEDKDESDEAILPVLSSGEYSNTFLRIDIDDAPTDARGNIYWASSGNDNITGKRLSLPIRVKGQAQNGKIPHYLYLQSQERLDWGRDINTLNCITINMPIYFSVCVDPDAMNLYAPAGAANGIYFISTLNVQTAHVYEIQYPDSNILCETFPMGKRRGYYGFDGISIYQEVEPPQAPTKPTIKEPVKVEKPAVVNKPIVVEKPTVVNPPTVSEPVIVEKPDEVTKPSTPNYPKMPSIKSNKVVISTIPYAKFSSTGGITKEELETARNILCLANIKGSGYANTGIITNPTIYNFGIYPSTFTINGSDYVCTEFSVYDLNDNGTNYGNSIGITDNLNYPTGKDNVWIEIKNFDTTYLMKTFYGFCLKDCNHTYTDTNDINGGYTPGFILVGKCNPDSNAAKDNSNVSTTMDVIIHNENNGTSHSAINDSNLSLLHYENNDKGGGTATHNYYFVFAPVSILDDFRTSLSQNFGIPVDWVNTYNNMVDNYKQQKQKYDQYLTDLNSYNKYLSDKKTYDDQNNAYQQYLLDLNKYNQYITELSNYENYLKDKQKYEQYLVDFNNYTKTMEEYNKELEEYNKKLEEYNSRNP